MSNAIHDMLESNHVEKGQIIDMLYADNMFKYQLAQLLFKMKMFLKKKLEDFLVE